MPLDQKNCTKSSCFFCTMKEKDSNIRRTALKDYLKCIPSLDNEELILVVSELWSVAMTRPDDDELPSLGVFETMATLMSKAVHDKAWLLQHQNIYIPYYAAHIVGSYTMNKAAFAAVAVDSGVVMPLLELLRGKMSWVEQRVAVRALGHLASYEETFNAIAVYEEEVVGLAMDLAASCLDEVYNKFVGIKRRMKYHCDLLTRGAGGADMEDRKAEEWASQIQCWSIHLLNCFSVKGRGLNLICKLDFLEELSGMWGGLANDASPAGIGLIRVLCYSKVGRESISRSRNVVENLCNLARSSDDWQYMGIDCLLLLLNDPDVRYNVIEVCMLYLVDLIELQKLGNRTNVGEAIRRAVLRENRHQNSEVKRADTGRLLQETSNLEKDRRMRERFMSSERIESERAMAKLVRQQGNHKFSSGEIAEARLKYSEALEICPLRYRKERIRMYRNRAQCSLLLRDADAAISDSTRALCLTTPANSHANSLWIRSQAYDMKGMARESLMDCITFINVCVKSKTDCVRVPYQAVRMICKQMDATWLFRAAQTKALRCLRPDKAKEECENDRRINGNVVRMQVQKKNYGSGLWTILEETVGEKDGSGRKKVERGDRRNKTLLTPSI